MINNIKLWFFSIWFVLKNIPLIVKVRHSSTVKDKKRKSEIFILKYMNYIIKKLKITVEVRGEENLKFSQNSLFVANHSSMLDPYFIINAIQKSCSFFIAGEFSYLDKIPLIKDITIPMENIFIHRDDFRTNISSLKDAAKRLEKGNDLFIFPEGEISHLISDEKIGAFKYGSFKPALVAKKNIQPITIIGSEKIQKKVSMFGPIKSGNVTIIIHPPVLYDDFKTKTTKEVSLEIHSIIKRSLYENK